MRNLHSRVHAGYSRTQAPKPPNKIKIPKPKYNSTPVLGLQAVLPSSARTPSRRGSLPPRGAAKKAQHTSMVRDARTVLAVPRAAARHGIRSSAVSGGQRAQATAPGPLQPHKRFLRCSLAAQSPGKNDKNGSPPRWLPIAGRASSTPGEMARGETLRRAEVLRFSVTDTPSAAHARVRVLEPLRHLLPWASEGRPQPPRVVGRREKGVQVSQFRVIESAGQSSTIASFE